MYSDAIQKHPVGFNPGAFPLHFTHPHTCHVHQRLWEGRWACLLSSCTVMPGGAQAVSISTSRWLAHSWKSSSCAPQLHVFLNGKESTQFAGLLYFVIFECISAPDTQMSATGILLSFFFIQRRIKESSILCLYQKVDAEHSPVF